MCWTNFSTFWLSWQGNRLSTVCHVEKTFAVSVRMAYVKSSWDVTSCHLPNIIDVSKVLRPFTTSVIIYQSTYPNTRGNMNFSNFWIPKILQAYHSLEYVPCDKEVSESSENCIEIHENCYRSAFNVWIFMYLFYFKVRIQNDFPGNIVLQYSHET